MPVAFDLRLVDRHFKKFKFILINIHNNANKFVFDI